MKAERSMEHTPGPWKACKGVEDEPDRWQVVVDGPLQYSIAIIENGQPGDTLETEGHTAWLIAASPDLLRACKVALEFFHNPGKFNPVVVERVFEAAIAKAQVQV